ncbi:putative ribonuclease H-like domain-containing protein, partial [Tanacetum coccineum]
MRPFRYHVTILNTLDYLGKFDGNFDEGFFVGYSMNSKAFRVYNIRTRKVEENLHIRFLEDKPIIAGDGPKWLFDIDVLTKLINYVPVVPGTNSNDFGRLRRKSIGTGFLARRQDLAKDLHFDATMEDVLSTASGRMTKTTIGNKGLKDPKLDRAMQKELLQFKLQQVWTLVDLPYGKRAIGTKYMYKNKKDERCIVIRNKARLIAQAYASFKYFVVYQMDVKSAFLYGKIEEEVYVCQPPGFEDLEFPEKVYKVEKALYGLHQAPKAWTSSDTKNDGIFISQDKYVVEILKKFGFSTVKTASTPMETSKPLLKDAKAEDVDVHLYRSMIGSLMYLTPSRPDIMFSVCAYTRFQVTPKGLHLHAMKRIFRYLKGQPKLSLWYPNDSPFDLEAYTDSDYVGASLDRKSTTR